ncbi:hypothetical protein PS15p_207752 [Mucor circinelloides]
MAWMGFSSQYKAVIEIETALPKAGGQGSGVSGVSGGTGGTGVSGGVKTDGKLANKTKQDARRAQ